MDCDMQGQPCSYNQLWGRIKLLLARTVAALPQGQGLESFELLNGTKLTLQQRQEYDRLQIRGVACSWCRLRMLQGEGEGVGDRRAAPHR